MVALWGLGGVLSLIGALVFAELAGRFGDRHGGDWVYLRSAFGPQTAFLFAWAAFWVIRPGNIGAMSLTFARYFGDLVGQPWLQQGFGLVLCGGLCIVALTLINLWGLRTGAGLLRLLTVVKVGGILGLIVLAFSGPAGADLPAAMPATGVDGGVGNAAAWSWMGLLGGMVLVMYAYGGWNDVAFVAAEIRRPEKNVFRALIGGTLLVTTLYVLLNAGFGWTLGMGRMQTAGTVATDAIGVRLEGWSLAARVAGPMTSLLVCISCLGAINAMLITSPRILFAALTDWPRFTGAAGRAGVPDDGGQQMVSAGGVSSGRLMSWCLALTALVTSGLLLVSAYYADVFFAVMVVTAPCFWLFLGLIPLALIRLRHESGPAEGFRVPWYPLPAVVLAATCAAMVWAAVRFLIEQQFWYPAIAVGGLMAIGLGLAFLLPWRREEPVSSG